jgi:hypothetical protein
MTSVAGNEETHETGTATTLDQVVGTTTVTEAGIVMNDETGTATTAVLGTVAITLDETHGGMALTSTITVFGELAIVITNDDGKFETTETGTAATFDDQVDGMATEAGTKTNDDEATVSIAEAGTEARTADGTLSGTAEYST